MLLNQKNYNEAFQQWKDKGFPVPSLEYQVIFNCIYEAAKGVIRSSVKHYDDEADDKAMQLTIKIIERDEIGKHYYIESLGAYLGVCKLEFTISEKVQFYDKQESYEVILENGYDTPQEEELEERLDKTFYAIDDNFEPEFITNEEGEKVKNPKYDYTKIKQYSIEDIKNPDKNLSILMRIQ